VSNTALDVLIWVLIYGGLLAVCLGVFVLRTSQGSGWTLIGAGAMLAVAGAALLVVRSRRPEPGQSTQEDR
jgi:hypothetical protein